MKTLEQERAYFDQLFCGHEMSFNPPAIAVDLPAPPLTTLKESPRMPATKPRPTVDERQAFRQVFDSLVTSHMANNRRCNRQRAIRVVAQREPGLYAKYLAAISPPHMANDY